MEPDVGRLKRHFDAGTLVHPLSGPGTVDLGLALGSLCGVPDLQLSEGAGRLRDRIGESDRYLLVMVDGLGMHMLETLPEGSFLRSHFALELRAVFPSSTAPALTSLFTASWPASHGVPAWFTYLPEVGKTAAILPYVDRLTRRPVRLESERALYMPSNFKRYGRPVEWLVPQGIAESVYTRYASGGRTVEGYASLEQAVELAAARSANGSAGLTYLYHPDVDTAEHDFGALSEQALDQLQRADNLFGELAAAVKGKARFIVTADHGQITVGRTERHFLAAEDSLRAYLSVWPPAGEPRATFFHVRAGQDEAFKAAFRERFGQIFLLVSTLEAAKEGLLGPVPLDERSHRRIGDYIAIPAGKDVLIFEPETSIAKMVGFHGGLLPDEMRVPLVLG